MFSDSLTRFFLFKFENFSKSMSLFLSSSLSSLLFFYSVQTVVGCHHCILVTLLFFIMLLCHHTLWEWLIPDRSSLTSCPMGTDFFQDSLSDLPSQSHHANGDEWRSHRCSVPNTIRNSNLVLCCFTVVLVGSITLF